MSNKINGDYVTIVGELRWVKVPPFSQPEAQYKPKPGQENNTHYGLEVECDRDFHDELLEAGLSPMATLHKDKDNPDSKKRYLRLKSPKVNGKKTNLPDPVVVNTKGETITTAIGNGSKGEVYAQFERWKSQGEDVVALRFKKLVVTELVEYVKPEDSNPYEQEEAHSQDLNPSNEVNSDLWG